MKCPKCGFNSFEYYDNCIKCSGDLISYKQTYSIASIVLPQEIKEKMATEFWSAEGSSPDDVSGSGSTEQHDDIFSFNLPETPPSVPEHHNDDPFNFDEPLSGEDSSKSDDDVFADLLESTSQATKPSPAAVKAVNSPSGTGEFDLESFSWDDSPTVDTVTNEAPADDFDALFGETKVNPEK